MLNKQNKWLYGTVIFTVLFAVMSIVVRFFSAEELPAQVSGVLFQVAVTAIITVFLLNGQSATEEERDKSLRVFEKKQEVYHHFLDNFKQIIRDGKIEINVGENAESQIDELKELLFELGYIQLHTSEENTKAVFTEVAEIIKLLNYFESEGVRQQQQLPQFYAQLSQHLFKIISILKADLYGKETKTIERETVKELLESCDLFVQNSELDKYALQNYFWAALQARLVKKGYPLEQKDFKQDVMQFYARARNRHRWYGVDIPIHTFENGKTANFRVEIENTLFYGLTREYENAENMALETACKALHISGSPHWYGWKWFDRNSLDFWRLDSEAFDRLNHPMKRERLMDEITEELDSYIKQFQQAIQQQKE